MRELMGSSRPRRSRSARSLAIALTVVVLGTLAGVAVTSVEPEPASAVPTYPQGFQESTVFSGLAAPMAMRIAPAPDNRVFVAEKAGLVKVFDSLTDTTPTVVKDLSAQVHSFLDRGLVGIALDPGFPTKPYVYVTYLYDALINGTPPTWGDDCPTPPGPNTDGCTVSGRLSRFTVNASNVAGPEQVLLNDWCDQAPAHTLNNMQFGPDGSLYVSGGDGGMYTGTDYGQYGDPKNPCGDAPVPIGGMQTPPTAQGGSLRAQDLQTPSDPTSLSGTVIRINPDTGAPISTVGNDDNAKRIVGYGLRNPYRMAFRPGTNELYIGDVGWTRWDEINVLNTATDPKINYGWPCYEGPEPQPSWQSLGLNLCNNLYANPSLVRQGHFAYKTQQEVAPGDGCPTGATSVTGLAFYERGTSGNYPALYDGALFFSDYSRGCIYALLPGVGGVPNPANVVKFGSDARALDLQTGPGGDLFYVSYEGGAIRRIRYFGANVPPVAEIEATPVGGPLPLTVQFDGTSSSDPDNQPLTYAWDLDGDGQFDDSTLPNPSRLYTTAGSITAAVRVADPGGLTATATRLITPGNSPPTLNVTAPSPAFTWAVGNTINFAASASDPEQGTLPASAFTWTVIVKHCPTPATCHTHPYQTFTGMSSGSFAAPDHEYPAHLEITVTAKDSGNQTASQTLVVNPKTTTLTIQASPIGLFCVLNDGGGPTPYTATVIQGSRNSVNAPPQTSGTALYEFNSWSDGGAASHDVTPVSPTTLTATFAQILANVGSVTVTEGNTGIANVSVPIVLTNPAQRVVTVAWNTNNGTAKDATDYSGRSGEVVFQPGELLKIVQVPIFGDTVAEPSEYFQVKLGVVTNSGKGQDGVVTIADNDGAPPVIQPTASSIVEGNTGTKVLNVPVALQGSTPFTASATWVTLPGTATDPTDYPAAFGVVSFTPGQTTANIPITINGDVAVEPNETFSLVLFDGVNAAPVAFTTLTIINDDIALPVASITSTTVAEGPAGGGRTANASINLSQASSQTVTVTWGTGNNSAKDATDYNGRSGTETFTPGQTTKPISIPIVGDAVPEPTESFPISIWSTTNATIGTSGVVTITDEDGAPPVIVPGAASIAEGNTGNKIINVPVTLQGSSPYTVSATWVTILGDASWTADYVQATGTVTFAPGQTSATVPITIKGDFLDENNEVLGVWFGAGSNAAIGGFLGLGVATITDDDPTPTVAVSWATVSEGVIGGVLNVPVTLSAPSGRTVSVSWTTANGTAIAGSDYGPNSGTVVFAPGEFNKTVAIPIFDNPGAEPAEYFFVTLSGATNAVLGHGSLVVINDDG